MFFDFFGLLWRYEAEGFDLGAEGPYLPDFEVRDQVGRLLFFAEVKPFGGVTDKSLRKCAALARQSGELTLMLEGEPLEVKLLAMHGEYGATVLDGQFFDCRRCASALVVSTAEYEFAFNCICEDYKPGGLTKRVDEASVKAASYAARQERFTT